MTAPSDKQMPAMRGWPAGIDNLNKEQSLTRDETGRVVVALRDAENTDLDRQGKPSRRDGYRRVLTAANSVHSLWGDDDFPFGLYVDGGTLRALREDATAFDLRTGMGPKALSYALVAGQVYWANEQQTGRVTADGAVFDWGVPGPNGTPMLAAANSGALYAGRYQVAVTFLSAAGEESGAAEAAVVDVPDGGGIAMSAIPQPPDLSMRIRVYASPANGDVLYFARDLAAGMTSAILGQHRPGKPLETQFLDPMPPGHIVRWLNGRLYVAAGSDLIWSEALRYGLCDLANNRIGLPKRLAMLEPVDAGGEGAGLFVASGERTYWMGGTDPARFSKRIAHPHGVVPGTSIEVPRKVFGLDGTGNVVYWLADNGVGCLGLPGGEVMPLRDDQAQAPSADAGASLLRNANGMHQVVTTLQNATERGLAIGDRAECTVVRHDQ